MRAWNLVVALLCLCGPSAAGGEDPPASVVLRARVYDGAATSRALHSAVRNQEELAESLKVPLPGTAVEVQLLALDGGEEAAEDRPSRDPAPVRTWTATTDSSGDLSLDLGVAALPPGHALVVVATVEGARRYSPFFLPREASSAATPQPIHLYRPTEAADALRADVRISYDIQRAGDVSIRVRMGIHLMNAGEAMYVGRRAGASREVWRLPVPRGATIVENKGPQVPGLAWRLSEDRRWLVLDAPIPGLADMDVQGSWNVHYLVPARQHFVQTFPVPLTLDRQQMTVWAPSGDLKLQSPQLRDPFSGNVADPFTGEQRAFDIVFSGEPVRAGTSVRVALSADNAALGQVSTAVALRVGGFVLLLCVAFAAGMLLGPRRGAAPGAPASGDVESPGAEADVIDRIVALDRRFERGQLLREEYQRTREELVRIAARELEGAAPATAGADSSGSAGPGSAAMLPSETRRLLRQLDELEASPRPDFGTRSGLLDAIARSLPRERGAAGNGESP